jgi:hypothetical protein
VDPAPFAVFRPFFLSGKVIPLPNSCHVGMRLNSSEQRFKSYWRAVLTLFDFDPLEQYFLLRSLIRSRRKKRLSRKPFFPANRDAVTTDQRVSVAPSSHRIPVPVSDDAQSLLNDQNAELSRAEYLAVIANATEHERRLILSPLSIDLTQQFSTS